MRIIYVPLEPYKDRYTLQLRKWNEDEFKRLGVTYSIIDGMHLTHDQTIKVGAVLDAHGRSYYALSQIMILVKLLSEKQLTRNDFILFEDMFHPGIEALAYIMDQQYAGRDMVHRPRMGARCLAQTIDPDDFTHYTNMHIWMRPYEQMVIRFLDIVFAASQEMLTFMTAAGWQVPVAVTGLPFGKKNVLSWNGNDLRPFDQRKMRVVFTSRVVAEKQPEFFIKVAEIVKREYPGVEFAFVSGGRISYPGVDLAVLNGTISVYPFQEKGQYYKILNDSRVLFNCALQDWVSNTLSEADALGCNAVFPAYRSFPEALFNDRSSLYIPWSISDAVDRVHNALRKPSPIQGKISDYQDRSIERTVAAINGESKYLFSNPCWPADYRRKITEAALGE